jgi:4,5-DOPA dioxygenase extradiol
MTTRRAFLRALAAGAALATPLGCQRAGAGRPEDEDMSENTSRGGGRMPIVFAGHGSPMNVVEDNSFSRGFAKLSELVPRPTAILAISAHWFVAGTYLTGEMSPKTIHDFSGFPKALYEIEYPAPGHVDLAARVRSMLGDARASLRTDWGYDHGTWSVLSWMYPQADVPVIQLSINRRLSVREHYELGRSLADLRYEGVLILGSGNAVHNLGDAFQRMRSGRLDTPDWALRFDAALERVIENRDTRALLSLWPDTDDGRLAHPTPDHWLPLIYAYAASDEDDEVRFTSEAFDLGSISMRNVILG